MEEIEGKIFSFRFFIIYTVLLLSRGRQEVFLEPTTIHLDYVRPVAIAPIPDESSNS